MNTDVLLGKTAFWEYDRFPYMLSGTINSVRISNDLRVIVELKEYGPGHGFYAFATLDAEKGPEVRKQLELLQGSYEDAQKSLQREYVGKLKNLLRQAGITHPEKTIKFSK